RLRRQHPRPHRQRERGRARGGGRATDHRVLDGRCRFHPGGRMSDCLFLPLSQRASGIRELTGWEAVWTPPGEGEAERLTIGRGVGWKPIEVPRQLAASEGHQAVWYRTEFARPDHAGRVLLRIGGAFLATHAWLNGKLLGSHYGYFAPFGFDLTPYLKPENLLVICCESPVE